MTRLSRRDFLAATLVAPGLLGQASSREDARYLADVALTSPGAPMPPFGRLLGDGLDARLFTDLSRLRTTADLRTPNDRFFVRSAAPAVLPAADTWKIRIAGLVQSPVDLAVRELEALATPPVRVLLECSGNSDPTSYGLLSAADWQGIPLAAVLDRARSTSRSSRVLVSGSDDDTRRWRTSIAGASWIFTRDQLAPAILAIRMNGEPLPRDHGAPVRLIVPGWYGCACIKWVDRLELVPDDAAATSQMREFAARTHQPPAATRAREFEPATIDTAAMPVRVEKWIAGGRPEYRIAGILWGGTKPTNALSIRFRAGGAWSRVDRCPMPESTDTWTLWTHTWRPTERGRYQIVLRVDDPAVRTRRLDIFFYVREVQIDEV
jgi:DMSO/TMAO reductase YedYZ molybdopterin-dependent catalytic subunit